MSAREEGIDWFVVFWLCVSAAGLGASAIVLFGAC